MFGSSLEAIDRHIETHVGKVEMVFHEIMSDLEHIDVHQVPPTNDRPFFTLITSGMSDRPMSAPEQAPDCKYAELMLCLPPTWPITQEAFNAEENYWPERWLKILARFPHEHNTWLWFGHTMPNGDPPQPFAPNEKFSCMMLGPAMTVSAEFWKLRVPDEKTIFFFSVLPILPDETDFKLKHGADAFLECFVRAKQTELIDPQRKSVLSRPWWKVF